MEHEYIYKISELEQGKWYANPSWTNRMFCKFSHLNPPVVNSPSFTITDSVDTKNLFHKGPRIFRHLPGSKYRLVSLEELSEYLPDDHPDKIPLFIEGEWYTCSHWGKYSYAKYKKVSNPLKDRIYFSESIREGSHHFKKDWWYIESKDKTSRVSLSEIKPFLPPNYFKDTLEFIPGKWYYCNCNSNMYRFHSIQENKYFCTSAGINPGEGSSDGYQPGYTEKIEFSSSLQYFNPVKLVPEDVIKEFIKPVNNPVESIKDEKLSIRCYSEEQLNKVFNKLAVLGKPIKRDFFKFVPPEWVCVSFYKPDQAYTTAPIDGGISFEAQKYITAEAFLNSYGIQKEPYQAIIPDVKDYLYPPLLPGSLQTPITHPKALKKKSKEVPQLIQIQVKQRRIL